MSSVIRRAGAKLLRLIQRAADPAVEVDRVLVYPKDVAGTSQLFALSDDGTVHQLTPITSGAVTAGAGLTGGGVPPTTLDVGANADGSITVNANDIQVGVLATDAQHGVRGGGTQHALAVAGGAAGFFSGAEKTKITSLQGINRVIAQPADGSDFMVTIPVAMPDDSYVVVATVVNALVIVGVRCPDSAAGDRTTVAFRVVTSAPLATGDTIDFLVMDR